MKNNCKGFVMVEALIVTAFVVAIFTFMYTSVVPLLGKYENLENQSNIDSIYRLYAIRQYMYKELYKNDSKYWNNLPGNYGQLTSVTNDTLTKILNISNDNTRNKYNIQNIKLFYVKNISDVVNDIRTAAANNAPVTENDILKNYIKNYNDVPNNVLFMYSEETKNDKTSASVVHIGLAPDLTKPMVYR